MLAIANIVTNKKTGNSIIYKFELSRFLGYMKTKITSLV